MALSDSLSHLATPKSWNSDMACKLWIYINCVKCDGLQIFLSYLRNLEKLAKTLKSDTGHTWIDSLNIYRRGLFIKASLYIHSHFIIIFQHIHPSLIWPVRCFPASTHLSAQFSILSSPHSLSIPQTYPLYPPNRLS